MKKYTVMRDASLLYVGQGTYRLYGIPINHANIKIKQGQYVTTTPVVRKDFKNKEFETQNTVYRIYSWSKEQTAEWQAISARALQGPVANIGIPKRVRGADSGGSQESRH